MQQLLAIRAFICSLFVLSILAKENAALSACLEAAPPVAPSHPSTDARAARLAKFKREQRIVEYLNRGVSVAEIAARVGIGEKRMRAVIKDPRTGSGGWPAACRRRPRSLWRSRRAVSTRRCWSPSAPWGPRTSRRSTRW